MSVAPPLPPAGYSLPAGATLVHNGAELAQALPRGGDIVLADGVYDQSSPFSDASGARLYAQNLGGAVFHTGIVVGGNFGSGGAVLRGLRFDLTSPAKALGGGIVHVWGPGGAGTQVLDCVFRGNAAIPVGLLALNPSGLRVERVQLAGFTDEGIRASDNVTVAYGGSTPRIALIQDVSVDGVSRSTPGASNGTAEAGLWVGHPVTGGVHRIRVRNVSWSGIETVNNAWDTSYTDLDVDMGGAHQAAGVGVYLEHYSRNLTFNGFTIVGAKAGFNSEWADPAVGGVAAAHGVVIENGTIDASGSSLPGNQAGVYLDEGSESTTVRNVRFLNQNWAGIGAYKNVGTNSFTGNSFQLRGTATQVSAKHI